MPLGRPWAGLQLWPVGAPSTAGQEEVAGAKHPSLCPLFHQDQRPGLLPLHSRASDGRLLSLSVRRSPTWQALCQALGTPGVLGVLLSIGQISEF